MPNTDPQAILIANTKIRLAADRFAQSYNLFKMLQAEGIAESWLTLFPADSEVIVDGSAIDGRTPITNQNIRDFIGDITNFINFCEASSNVVRNRALLIAVNPERV